MSRRINIVLPDETISVLDRVTSTGTRSAFISKAVLCYIESRSRDSLRQKLEAGYRANFERDVSIAAEWFPLEEEASRGRKGGEAVKAKRAVKPKRT